MKIAMIGSGAAGSVFASYLRAGGADMWLVDRYKAHMDKVAADGMRFITPSGERLLTGFRTAYSADAIGEMDIVILMVKATQTEAIMPSVSPCIGENTVVVSLQNGLDNDRILSAFLPAERIICGFGIIGTELREPGVCAAKPEEGILMRFGACKKSYLSDAAGEYLEAAFTRGGCPARYEPDIWPFIWKKAISNSGYNTVSAILGLKVGQVLANEHGRKLILDVWRRAVPWRRPPVWRPVAGDGGLPAHAGVRFQRLLPLHGPGHAAAPAADGNTAPERRHSRLRRQAGRAGAAEPDADGAGVLRAGKLRRRLCEKTIKQNSSGKVSRRSFFQQLPV
jgi:2-dehydropantoate 2-reductase